MKNQLRLIAAALAACAAVAQADNDAVQTNPATAVNVQQVCIDAAKARDIQVSKAERAKTESLTRFSVTLHTERQGSIDCDYDATTKTATLLGLPARGNDLDRSPLVKICEKVAEQQDIRLGRFDELKPLDGRRVEVRFDRAFFVGKRHSCVVDQAKNLVSFDGGKAVALPGTAPSKK